MRARARGLCGQPRWLAGWLVKFGWLVGWLIASAGIPHVRACVHTYVRARAHSPVHECCSARVHVFVRVFVCVCVVCKFENLKSDVASARRLQPRARAGVARRKEKREKRKKSATDLSKFFKRN